MVDEADPLGETAASNPDPLAATTDAPPRATPLADAQAIALGATVDSEQTSREIPLTFELPTIESSRYVDRKLLAQGGMGKVILARDTRLGRRVALKELRIDNEALRARFERETILTARLEHPGIVGVHEAGRWPSGEPFFAMRVISGRSLDKRFAEAKDLRTRLGSLPNVLAVADAMAYAHDQGVIHRDLKPHNIMVGEFGETVVIDWGLAKDVSTADVPTAADSIPSQSGALTTHGSVIGTPYYLPPEQAKGESVDRTADVYAIGAILYELLAGAPPYSGRTTAQQIIDAVLAGPPAPLGPETPAELRTIVERAMAREPADRYPSARELANDLRKFQTGQLVGAHRYTLRDLLGRWVKKRRGILITATIAIVVVVVIGVISVRNIMAERAEAERQSARAELNRQRAEHVLTFMQQDVRDQLAKVNRLDLLEPVARKAIEYRASQPFDQTSLIGLVEADRQLISSLLAGGRLAEADRAIDHALAIFALLDQPTAKQRRDGSTLFNLRGDIAQQRGDAKGAIAHYRRALDVVEELYRDEPAEFRYAVDIAFGLGKLVDTKLALGDTRGALEDARRAETVLAGVSSTENSDELALQRAKVPQRLGELLARTGDGKGALAQLDRARQMAEAIYARKPSWQNEREIAVAHQRIAHVRTAMGDDKGAVTAVEAALAIATKQYRNDAANAIAARDVVILSSLLGSSLVDLDQFEAARQRATEGIAVAETLVARDPNNPQSKADLAALLEVLSQAELGAKQIDRGLELARRALAVRAELASRDASNAAWRRGLMLGHNRLGTALLKQLAYKEARTEFVAALEIAKRAAAANPKDLSAQRELSVGHFALAKALYKMKDLRGALAEYQADLAIARTLAAADPNNPKSQHELAQSLAQVGGIQDELRDRAGTKASYEEALAILGKIAPLGSKLAGEIRKELARCCR